LEGILAPAFYYFILINRMKRILFALIVLVFTINARAQVKIGDNPATLNSNSLLELESTDKGLLLPRLTSAQVAAMNNPPKGMVLFNSTDSSIYLRRDTGWVVLAISAASYWQATGNDIVNTNTGKISFLTNDEVVAKGSFGNGNNLTESGAGTKLIWYPKKSAFRAGTVTGTDWDDANIGNYTIGLGYNAKANGLNATAIGQDVIASGVAAIASGYGSEATSYSSLALGYYSNATSDFATAIGYINTANNHAATAIGYGNTASGEKSISIGYLSSASGSQSMTLGTNIRAKGFSTVAVGMFNDPILTTDETVVTSTTPMFIVGNGSSSSTRSNAMVVRKDGNVGIGTNTPTSLLQVNGTVTATSFSGSGTGLTGVATSASPSFTGNVTLPGTGIWNSSGNVGIGTSSPSSKLHVNGTITATAFSGSGTGLTGVATSASPTFTGNITMPGTGIWNSSGNVGVGTTSPTSKLHVNGTVTVTGDVSLPGTGIWNSSGNVGVGTTTPTSKLQVNGTVTATAFSGNGSAISNIPVANVTGAAPNASPTFTGNVSMPGPGIWNSAGKVGIGTTSPQSTAMLEVNGRIRVETGSYSGLNIPSTATSVLTINHNMGYQPVLMISLDQTGGAFMDYVTYSYLHVDNNNFKITLRNHHTSNNATGTVRWVVVY
jgi:hypothetical protein